MNNKDLERLLYEFEKYGYKIHAETNLTHSNAIPMDIVHTLMLIPMVKRLLENPQDEYAYKEVENLIAKFELLLSTYAQLNDYYHGMASTEASVGGSA